MKERPLQEFLKRKKLIDSLWLGGILSLHILAWAMWRLMQFNIPFMTLLKVNLPLVAFYILLQLFIERAGGGVAYIRKLTLFSLFIMLIQITATIHLLGGSEGFLFFSLYLLPIVAAGLLFSGWYAILSAFLSAGLLASLYLLEDPSFVLYLVNMGLPRIFADIFARIRIPDYEIFGFELAPEVMLYILLAYFFVFLAVAAHSQFLDYLYGLTVSMEKDIRGREDIINASLFNAPVGFVVGYGSNYNSIYLNKRIMDLFGFTEEEVKNKNIFSIFCFGPYAAEFIKKTIAKREPVELTAVPIATRNGRKAFFQISLSFFKYTAPEGEEGLFLLAMNNITEELRMAGIITNSRDATILIDSSGKVNFYNRAAMEAFPDLLKGMPLKQILSAARAFSADISAAILKGDTVDGKVSLKGKSFLFSSSLLKDVTGIELGILFSLKDITREEVFYNLSMRDELTGVYNRRYFFEVMEKELAQAQRYPKRLSLAVMDIDFFKKVNDTYGHNAGDHVLKTFARTISIALRKADIFARVGGEEFSLYMPFTDLDGAENICSRIRREVEGLSITFEGNAIPVTCSIGVAEYAKEEGITQLTAKADAALYEAKNCGRNRVVIFSESILAKA